jgi:hypothetical protein
MNEHNFSLRNNGIEVISKFLGDDVLEKLRFECSDLFSYTRLLAPKYKVRISKYLCEIPQPASILRTINLLELGIKVSKLIEDSGYSNFKISHIALYQEKNNPHPLSWHSDVREGQLIRAQIIIKGGGLSSGAFRYILNSHENNTEYFPKNDYIKINKELIFSCNLLPNGSLTLINTNGYHSKCECIDERISIMFDFLPLDYLRKNVNDCLSNIHIPTSLLTDNVINNLNFFQTEISVNNSSPNTSDNYFHYYFLSGANFRDMINDIFFVLRRKLLIFFKSKINRN